MLKLPQEQQLNQMLPTLSVRDLYRPIRGCALFSRNPWLTPPAKLRRPIRGYSRANQEQIRYPARRSESPFVRHTRSRLPGGDIGSGRIKADRCSSQHPFGQLATSIGARGPFRQKGPTKWSQCGGCLHDLPIDGCTLRRPNGDE